MIAHLAVSRAPLVLFSLTVEKVEIHLPSPPKTRTRFHPWGEARAIRSTGNFRTHPSLASSSASLLTPSSPTSAFRSYEIKEYEIS